MRFAGGLQGQLTIFDYEALDTETRIVVQQRTSEIRERELKLAELVRQTALTAWKIGEGLADVRSRLKHGEFLPWLRKEFPEWSQKQAYRFLNVYENLKFVTVTNLDLPMRALYLLAAPSTPEEARQDALARAAAGEEITHATAKEIVAQHRPARRQPRSVQGWRLVNHDCGR